MATQHILIDNCDEMASYIERRVRAEVEQRCAAARRAHAQGHKRAAAALDADWSSKDELAGMVTCWMLQFIREHRASVVAALIDGWPKIPTADEEWDALIEAAD